MMCCPCILHSHGSYGDLCDRGVCPDVDLEITARGLATGTFTPPHQRRECEYTLGWFARSS